MEEDKKSKNQKDVSSNKLSTSPTKKKTFNMISSNSNSRNRQRSNLKTCSNLSPLQSKLNTVRSDPEVAAKFYDKIKFSSRTYGLNAYCPGMNKKILDGLFILTKNKKIKYMQT